MASPINRYAFYCFSLIALLLLRPSSLAMAADFTSPICSGTLDPTHCVQVIKTIPGCGEAPGLESLGETAIIFSLSKGNETLKYVQSLVASTDDPKLKEVYSSCAENNDDAMRSLDEAQGKLKSKDYISVSMVASGSMTDVDTCNESFKERSMVDPSELPNKNKYFHTLSLIILRIANKLRE